MVTRIVFSRSSRDAHRARVAARWPSPRSLAGFAGAGEEATGRADGRRDHHRRPPTSPATWPATAPRCAALLAPNSDPHDYELRPGDMKALGARRRSSCARAATSTSGSAARSTARAPTRPCWTCSDRVGAEGEDPHWWQDPRRAVRRRGGDRAPRWRRPIPRAPTATRQRAERLPRAPARARRRRRALRRRGAGGAAQARDHPRRARLLRAPLRPRGDRHGDPGAVARRRRRRPATSRSWSTPSAARTCRAIFAESSVNAKVEDAIAQRDGRARRARRCGRTRSGPAGSSGATYVDSIRANTAAIVDGLTGASSVHAAALILDAPYLQRALVEIAAARRARRACSAPGSCCAGSPSTRTPSGPPRSRGWSSPCRGRVAPQLTALAAALGFGAALERLSRARRLDAGAATGLLLVAALAGGIVLASDVYESGAGVDRLLFGTLIGLTRPRPVADGGRGGRRARAARRAAPLVAGRGLRPRQRPRAGRAHDARRPPAAGRGGGGGRGLARRRRRAARRGRARRPRRDGAAGGARRARRCRRAPPCWPPWRASSRW